ncbi:hypothetical protein [Eubacterium limosum]|uniref:hypothetical protein n=1 Tax=Eubacterium limosum TaxID=1736 RepID=UPI001559D9A1|nr:hypothetical protein [Eubacterium limosum]
MKKNVDEEYQDIEEFYLMIAELPEEKKTEIKEKIKESESIEKSKKNTLTAE